MGYPTDYLAGDAGSNGEEGEREREVSTWLAKRNLVATRREEDLVGVVARVRIDVFGSSASEVEATLLAYGKRCDAAANRPSCAYGECVIERNLAEEWGNHFSWRGRLILHPDVGTEQTSQRIKDQVASD